MICSSRSLRQLRDERPRAPAVLVLPDLHQVGLAGEMLVEHRAILRPRLDVERPAVAARARHRAAGREDARRDDRAGARLLAQREDERALIAGVEDRRHARVEKRVQRADAVALLVRRHRLLAGAIAAAAQMRVHVDQAGNQELAAAVDDLRPRRRRHRLRRDLRDAIAFDDHGRVGERAGRCRRSASRRE